MSRESVLARGRAAAVAGMTDRVVIRTETPGAGFGDPPVQGPIVYPAGGSAEGGPAELQMPGSNVAELDAASQLVAIQDLILKLPAGTLGVETGMVATFVSSSASPWLAGVRIRIIGQHPATHTTAQRHPVEVVS